MPSQKPRLNITLDDDIKEVLIRLSKLQNKPQAAIVNEYLREMYPFLVSLADALEDVENKKSAFPNLIKMSAEINKRAMTVNSDMSDMLSQVGWVNKDD